MTLVFAAARRVERAQLGGDRLGHRHEGVRAPHDRARHPPLDAALGAHAPALVAAVRVVEPRVAQVGDPRRSGRGRGGLPDQVHRGRRRRRHDRVDPAPAHDPDGRGHGGCGPRQGLVGDERPLVGVPGLHGGAAEAVSAAQGIAPKRRARAEEAGAVDGGGGGDLGHERLVEREPFGIAGREHVHVHAELGQVAAELERALDTATARRGEVERDQEQAHGEPV